MRGFRRSDRRSVLALIAADRLPGQPRPTATALVSALAARGPDGRPQARALQPPVTEILLDARRRITGVISYALRPYDGAGVVLWAHAAEDPSTMAVLMGWARVRLGPDRPWYAFPGIPATSTTEGLARSRRPATTHALRTTGFTAIAERQYWNRDLRRNPPTGPLPHPLATTAPQHGPRGLLLRLTRTDGTPAAEARIDTPDRGTAHLHRLVVAEADRSRGLGRHLLDQCLFHAARTGAPRLTATTDATDPHDPAVRLLSRAGFTPVDTLAVYHRPGRPAGPHNP